MADPKTFDTFLIDLKAGLAAEGLSDVWPCFIVGKVGTDLHTTTFDPEVAKELTAKVRPYGSYIKGHYTDDVSNPEAYPMSGMGAANVGPEFTMNEYDALAELEQEEIKHFEAGSIPQLSHITRVLWQQVYESGRWKKWLHGDEVGKDLSEVSSERQLGLVKTGCRYIWQKAETLVARQLLYDNLKYVGVNAEEVVLMRIEHNMDKYYRAFNLIDLNDMLGDL